MAWTQTKTGKLFSLKYPNSDAVDIEDIAHSLSQICRFGGHTREFYSVAQHSVECAIRADVGFQLEALLHDAHEAYLGDICTPLKDMIGSGIRRVDNALATAVRDHFGLPNNLSANVHHVDQRMLVTEASQLMGDPQWAQDMPYEKFDFTLNPWAPTVAKTIFLDTYKEYSIIRGAVC